MSNGQNTKTAKLCRFVALASSVLLLANVIWLTLPVIPAAQAQESEARPTPGQRPARGSGDGSGRRLDGQSGIRGDGRARPAAPLAAETNTADEGTSTAAAHATSIVAIAGVGGAGLADRPQAATVYVAPVGTVMQATGRTDDGKWLYVARDAVNKGGEEVEPALAGWSPTTDLIAFSIDSLPILDVDETPITLPDPMQHENLHVGDAGDLLGIPNESESGVEDDVESGETVLTADDTEAMAISGVVNLVNSRLNVRTGPGTATAIHGKLLPSESVSVLGRSEGATWLLISGGASGDLTGWVAADFIDIDGSAENLTIVSVSTVSVGLPEARVKETSVPASSEERSASAVAASSVISASSDLIVFQTSPGATFYAYDLASGAFWPLTRGFDPAISPDGQTVVFTRDGGENGIYLININGGNERRIFAERGRLASPKWSPNGDWIVFSRGNTFAECYQLGRSCLTASQIKGRLPNVELGKLELVREPRYHLAMVDATGGNYTDIAALDTARAPDWSEAGIVYRSSAGLQITDNSPGAENRLVIDDYLKPFFHDPDWQPGQGGESGRIAYMGKEGSHWEIFTVNPDGSGVTALTRPSTTLAGELPSNVAPAWSPDGSKIAFLSNRADKGGSDIWRLWIMDADGSNQRPLPVDLYMDYTFGDEQAVAW